MVKCEHDPVEQVRKDMGPGDYFDVVGNAMDEIKWVRELPADIHDQAQKHLISKSDYHQEVDLGAHNATDMRIICRKCFHGTGWMKVDAPGMPPGIGIAAVRAKWEEIRQYDAEEWNAIQRSRGVKTKLVTFPTG